MTAPTANPSPRVASRCRKWMPAVRSELSSMTPLCAARYASRNTLKVVTAWGKIAEVLAETRAGVSGVSLSPAHTSASVQKTNSVTGTPAGIRSPWVLRRSRRRSISAVRLSLGDGPDGDVVAIGAVVELAVVGAVLQRQ